METTTTPENAKSWRELVDQLTLAQIAQLEEFEKKNPPIIVDLSGRVYGVRGFRSQTPEELRSCLLRRARDHAQANLHSAMYAHVPPPAGAVSLWDDWGDPGDGIDCRYFDGTSRRVELTRGEYVEVRIVGTQYPDGHAERDEIKLDNVDSFDVLTRTQARQLAQAIWEACDEADALSDHDAKIDA
jgi:hypothetical protein